MKSKSIVSFIAIFAASSGAHRFYLGQNRMGWYFLLLHFVLFPGAIWYNKEFHITNHYMLISIWIAWLCVVHIAETIRFATMRAEKFEAQNKATGATLPLAVTSVIFAVAAVYGFVYLLKVAGNVDIETAVATHSISSIALSAAYNADEKSYMATYDGKVLEVSGRVLSFGEDFEKGSYLALQPAAGSPADVNCYLNAEYMNDLGKIAAGDSIVIKGVCNRRFLDNCKIMDIIK